MQYYWTQYRLPLVLTIHPRCAAWQEKTAQRTPLSLKYAQQIVVQFANYYNTKRLHSAMGHVTPQDELHGREKTTFSERDCKLTQARRKRAWRHIHASMDSLVRHSPSLRYWR